MQFSVQNYFDILVDTLIGFRLPGWQPKLKVREKLTPKFYLFDPGVSRALTGRIGVATVRSAQRSAEVIHAGIQRVAPSCLTSTPSGSALTTTTVFP